MVDTRFYINTSPHHVTYIAERAECTLASHSDKSEDQTTILNIAPIESAHIGDLTFLSNKKYTSVLASSLATACIIDSDYDGVVPNNMHLLRSKNAYYSYALALSLFYAPRVSKDIGSAIHPSARIGTNCQIGHYVVIEANVEIGNNVIIGAGTFIGQGVKIGDNVTIGPNVVIAYTIIGDDVVILPGAKIGQDGFGFATHKMKHYKIFHVGRVIIGNDVEIGANTTIDRGSLNDTVIGDGVRIDNLVQIGHNVSIDCGTIVVAQVGIAGSTTIGKYCALGGQVGISGHLKIADRVQIAGQGGVIQDITEPGLILGGTPAIPIRDWHRQSIMLKKMTSKR